jgi:hypothetical protein
MKSNATNCLDPPFDMNPLTRMWCLVRTSCILVTDFPKYVKLAKLVMVQVVGSVEDERCFSTLAFMKSKFHNKLTTHLPLIVHMFAFIRYIISHTKNALSNGKVPTIAIVMMAKVQWTSWFEGPYRFLKEEGNFFAYFYPSMCINIFFANKGLLVIYGEF